MREAQESLCDMESEVLIKKQLRQCDCKQTLSKSWVCHVKLIDLCQSQEVSQERLITGTRLVSFEKMGRKEACETATWEGKNNYCDATETLTHQTVSECSCYQFPETKQWECYVIFSNSCHKAQESFPFSKDNPVFQSLWEMKKIEPNEPLEDSEENEESESLENEEDTEGNEEPSDE